MASYSFRPSSEKELQASIERVLREAAIPFTREHRLTERDQPDFFVAGGIALEAKIDGSLTELTRQVARYADHPSVEAVAVISTRRAHAGLPETLSAKPIRFILAKRFL